MSATVTKWSRVAWQDEVFTHESLNASDRLVATVLGRYADERGQCYPGTRKLSSDTKLARNTVKAAIERLEKHGFVCRKLVKTETSFRYHYRLTRVKSLPDPGSNGDPGNGLTPGQMVQGGGSNGDPDPGQMAAKNSPRELTHKNSPIAAVADAPPDDVVEIWKAFHEVGRTEATVAQAETLDREAKAAGVPMHVDWIAASMRDKCERLSRVRATKLTSMVLEDIKGGAWKAQLKEASRMLVDTTPHADWTSVNELADSLVTRWPTEEERIVGEMPLSSINAALEWLHELKTELEGA